MKLELKLTNDWIEATWLENDEQVHCESFSGHPEHIAMLRARAAEFGTELDEALIKECIANFKMPTDEELLVEANKAKVQEARAYLISTEFKFNDDYDQKYIDEWLAIKSKRQEYREFIRANS